MSISLKTLHNKEQCWAKLVYKLMKNGNILKGFFQKKNLGNFEKVNLSHAFSMVCIENGTISYLVMCIDYCFVFLYSVSWFWDHWTSKFQACFSGWHCKCSCQSLCSGPWEGSFALTFFSLCCFFPPLLFVLAILRIIRTWKHFAKVKELVT